MAFQIQSAFIFGIGVLCACSSTPKAPVPAGGGQAGATSGGAGPGGGTSGGASSAGASPMGGSTNAGQGSGGASGSFSSSAGSGGGATAGSAGGGMPSTAVFMDDFEAPAIGAKWVRRINGGGTFALDTAHKHGGSQSLRTSPNNGYSTLLAIEGAPVFPAPNNTFYGRVWFWLPATTFQVVKPASGGPHVIWLEGGLAMNDTQELRIGMNLGYFQTNLWPGDTDLRDPSAVLKSETWQCLEFKMGTDDLEVWLDNTRSDAVSTKTWLAVNSANGGVGTAKTNWTPTYEAFRLGFELNGGMNDIYYDDVALGYSRIGCGN